MNKIKTLAQAIVAYNADPKAPQNVSMAAMLSGSYACLMIVDGKLDPALSEKALSFLHDLGEFRATGGKYKAGKTWDEFTQRQGLQADPSTDGVALDDDGISQDAAEVDWSKVSADRRRLVVYRRRRDPSVSRPDTDTRIRWAKELSEPIVQAPWSRLATDVLGLKASEIESLDEALLYRRPFVGAEPARDQPNHAASATDRPITSTSSADRPLTPPIPGVPHIVGIFDPADSANAEALRRTLFTLIHGGKITYWDQSMIQGGTTRQVVFEKNAEAAAGFLYLTSAHMLSSLAPTAAWLIEKYPNKRHIPILVRACDYISTFGGRRTLPERSVTAHRDADEAWMEIGVGIKRAFGLT